jgi:hypothetical protein
VRRALLDGVIEVRPCAIWRIHSSGAEVRGGAERPHAAAPAVLDAVAVVPAPVGVTAVAGPARDALGVDQEPQGVRASSRTARPGPGFADDDDQQPGHVVGAVAVLERGAGVVGVLEHPDRVAHRQHVIERGRGAVMTIGASGDDGTVIALGPTAAADEVLGESGVLRGDRRPRELGRQAAGLGRHRRGQSRGRSAPTGSPTPAPTGSRWGTTIPAPLASSSTAWGNAVDTTGRPAATASTRTPEVTCSRVVRQHDEVGRGDQLGQRPAGRGRCRRRRRGATAGGPARSISISRYSSPCARDLRVRRTGDEVLGERVEAVELDECVDRPLDALAGTEQAPRQQPGPAPPWRTASAEPRGVVAGCGAPWGMTWTLDASTSKPAIRRSRPSAVITTTASATRTARSSTPLAGVGALSTVWATTTDRNVEPGHHDVEQRRRRRDPS